MKKGGADLLDKSETLNLSQKERFTSLQRLGGKAIVGRIGGGAAFI